MKMKNLLLLLSALIAVPAWAADATPAVKPTAQPVSAAETGIVIVLKGTNKGVAALAANLEKEAVYKEANCSSKPAKKPGKTAKITCAKADGALLAFLSKNAPAKVQWSISAAATKSIPVTTKGAAYCPPPIGCAMMNCPPPGGPLRCCNQTTRMPC